MATRDFVAGAVGMLLILFTQAEAGARDRETNGFTLAPASIPITEIDLGGPQRDGIPALDHPESLRATKADWKEDALILGVVVNGEARAYPVAVLNWHELVNDTLGGQPILVSFCPLCGTGMVFDRRIDGKVETFGVSGLLYHSDILMYDLGSESLWSQIRAEALTGPRLGQRLQTFRAQIDRWGQWRHDHPGTTIVSRNTGYRRSYDLDPYTGYARSRDVMFPVTKDPRFHPKMPTMGLRIPGRGSRAYPASELIRAGGSVEEDFLGHRVKVSYDRIRRVFSVDAPPEVESFESFWFAWAAFNPDTSVFSSSDASL